MNILIITLYAFLLLIAVICPSYNLYIILAQLSLILFYIIYKIYTRKKMMAQEMILSNELPEELIPIVAGCLEKQRSCRYQDIIATLLDLIKREYLHVKVVERYGKKEITIIDNTIKNKKDLDVIEQSILHFILKGADKINLTDYTERLKQDTNEVLRIKSLLSSISNRISAKYYSSNAFIYIGLIFSVVEFYLFSMIRNNSIIMIPIFTLILTIIWLISFQAELLTTIKIKYLKLQGKLTGFKTYLIANTKLDDFNTAYIPYLIAFDVIDQVDLKSLKEKNHLIDIYQELNKIIADIKKEDTN